MQDKFDSGIGYLMADVVAVQWAVRRVRQDKGEGRFLSVRFRLRIAPLTS